jgi:PncC family amidohydrolase
MPEALAARIAARLIARKETVAVAESSAGGLIAAALLAVPGASAYFLGGAVIYTVTAREALLGVTKADMTGLRPASEPYARLLSGRMREKFASTWAIAETVMAMPQGTPASPLPARCRWRARSKPASPIGPRTCAASPAPRSNCSTRCWQKRPDGHKFTSFSP